MAKTFEIVMVAPNDVRVNGKEAGTSEGMEIWKPGTKKTVTEETARELLTYKQAELVRK